MSKFRSALDVAGSLAMVAAAVVVIWRATVSGSGRRPPPLPTALQTLDETPIIGRPSAPVAIIEYSDFECPFCGAFAREVLPSLDSAYIKPGRAQLAFRHHPLPIHPYARAAAEAAECASRLGGFREFHDQLFEHQHALDRASLLSYASADGFSVTSFATCLAGQAARKVDDDVAQALRLGLTGTPAFLIGTVETGRQLKVTQVITGARPLADFVDAIDRALSSDGHQAPR